MEPDIPALFLWMGISYYLEGKAVIRSLELAAQMHKASSFTMDYASPAEPGKQIQALRGTNEPILS